MIITLCSGKLLIAYSRTEVTFTAQSSSSLVDNEYTESDKRSFTSSDVYVGLFNKSWICWMID